MTEHFSIEDIDRYLLGDLAPSRRASIEGHIRTCSGCRSKINDRLDLAGSGLTLENALSARWPDHLTYEELESIVDNSLENGVVKRIEDHLSACHECRDEIAHLKAFAGTAGAELSTPATRSPGWFDQLTAVMSSRQLILVPAFGVLVASAASIWWLTQGKDPAEPPAPVEVSLDKIERPLSTVDPPPANADKAANSPPEPTLTVSLSDGGKSVGLDTNGALVGYAGLSVDHSKRVLSALRDGSVAVAPEFAELVPGSNRRMGNNTATGIENFRVVSPAGKVVDTGRPTFVWQPLEGADSYRVDVFDMNFRRVATSGELRTTQWSTDLPRGHTYHWQVTGIKNGTELGSTASEARFRTLGSNKSRDLAAIKRRYPRSHLLLGLAYADAGMIAESRREFEMLSRENQRSTIPKKLLLKLDKQRFDSR